MSDEQDQPRPEGHDEVGSLGEEAARLLGALSHWAREQAEEPGPDHDPRAAHGPLDDVLAAVHRIDDEVATGAPECRWCPVCRVVHAVRQTSPEVREHLAAAVGSLLEAASSLLATHVPTGPAAGAGEGRRQDPGGLERIDLDDDAEEWGAPEAGR